VPSQIDCRQPKFLLPLSETDERNQRTEDDDAGANTNPDDKRIQKHLEDLQDCLLILPLLDCETAWLLRTLKFFSNVPGSTSPDREPLAQRGSLAQ
jgi:hypothetical protein